jgi:DNA-binding response OmpR family regulator
LRRLGYVAREATTVADMHTALAEGLPDLVILDVNLPDASGFDVCRQLKSEAATAALPVVLISASYVPFENRERLTACGADAFLEQPLRAERLGEVVRELLARGSTR